MSTFQTIARVVKALQADLQAWSLYRAGDYTLAFRMAMDDLEECGVTAADVRRASEAWHRYWTTYCYSHCDLEGNPEGRPVRYLSLYSLTDLLSRMDARDAGTLEAYEQTDAPIPF
jgi:hypothetical protein